MHSQWYVKIVKQRATSNEPHHAFSAPVSSGLRERQVTNMLRSYGLARASLRSRVKQKPKTFAKHVKDTWICIHPNTIRNMRYRRLDSIFLYDLLVARLDLCVVVSVHQHCVGIDRTIVPALASCPALMHSIPFTKFAPDQRASWLKIVKKQTLISIPCPDI